MFGSGLQDVMLKAYVDKIFDKYDADRSGTLDTQEMTYFFNDLFKQLNITKKVTKQQSLEAIKTIDKNFDGGVDREQLFQAFKAMLSKCQQQQPQQPTLQNPPPPPNYNPGMSYSGGYGGYNGYPNQGGYYPPPPQYNGYPQSPFYPNQAPMYNNPNPMYGSAPVYGSPPMYGNSGVYQNPNYKYGHQGYQGYNPYMQNNNPYGGQF